MNITRKIRLLRNFGLKIFLADFCSSNIRIPRITARWKDKVLVSWLRKKYDYVVKNYMQKEEPPHSEHQDSSFCVWSMWWQGEENLPEVVDLCFTNIRKHCGAHKFIIITKNNYREYIDLPEHIFRKVDSGAMTLTHFSDIVRMYLLSHYGGMWLDSTILVTENIPDEIFAMNYYTLNRGVDINDYHIAMKRWNVSVQFAHKGCLLCDFVLNIFIEYWKDHNSLVDYVLVDYVMALAYESLPTCRTMLDAVPTGNYAFNELQHVLNEIFDAEKYHAMASTTQFFKMTYKHNFRRAKHGRETFYGYIMRNFLDKENNSPSDA